MDPLVSRTIYVGVSPEGEAHLMTTYQLLYPPPQLGTDQVIFDHELGRWVAMHDATQGVAFATEGEALTHWSAFHADRSRALVEPPPS